MNIELPDPDCYNHLVELVREGTLAEKELDELVAPMLAYKFRLGLFDDPYVDPATAERIVGSDPHREVALEAARKTITLLKNDGNILPLDAGKVKTIAVIGPNADRVLFGGYSDKPTQFITVLAGCRELPVKISRCSITKAARSRSASPELRSTKLRSATPKTTAVALLRR